MLSQEPHLVFIGRWCPLHKGHVAIIEQKLQECPDTPILVLVRTTAFDEFSAIDRATLVSVWMRAKNIRGSVTIIPDVKGVYYGRGVGYDVEEVVVSQKLQGISATEIRKRVHAGDDSWRELIACEEVADVFEEMIGKST